MRLKAIVFLCFMLCAASVNAQCAMCRAVLESEESQSTAQGINDGIMYLMAIPYLLIAAVGIIIYRKFKNSKEGITE